MGWETNTLSDPIEDMISKLLGHGLYHDKNSLFEAQVRKLGSGMQHKDVLTLTAYEPAFDGLRALAVIAVIAYHVSPRLVPGGWMGVDVFFVLSGYLITNILRREADISGTIDFRKFYIRRFLRLTPAFWFLLIVIALPTALFSKAGRAGSLQAVLISASYMMNWNRAFDVFPQGLLGHTWSLAMEEQFYIIWPFLFIFIYRRRPVHWTAVIIFAITLWRVYLVCAGADPERTYNGFDTHGDALLIGCMLALLPIGARAGARARAFLAIPVAGAILMLAGVAHRTFFTQTLGLTLASLLSAWLIVGAMQPSWLRRALSVRPLVYTGRISYGWYLWHLPIILFGQKVPLLRSEWGNAVLAIAAYPVAALSYKFVEQRFLRLKSQFQPDTTKFPDRASRDEGIRDGTKVAG
jgi:peptidoglycan/LPS O-acetylase OafA/YrhL